MAGGEDQNPVSSSPGWTGKVVGSDEESPRVRFLGSGGVEVVRRIAGGMAVTDWPPLLPATVVGTVWQAGGAMVECREVQRGAGREGGGGPLAKGETDSTLPRNGRRRSSASLGWSSVRAQTNQTREWRGWGWVYVCASRSGVAPAGRLHAQAVRRHTRAQPRGPAWRGRARERSARRTVQVGTPLRGLGSIALYMKRPYAGKRSVRRVAVPERRCARCGSVPATSSSVQISRACFQNSVTPKSVNILENLQK
jgi:ribosomal protein S14